MAEKRLETTEVAMKKPEKHKRRKHKTQNNAESETSKAKGSTNDNSF